MKDPFSKLEKILNDKTSGSSELLIRINKLFKDHTEDRKFFNSGISNIKSKLNHFAAINKYIENVSKLFNTKEQKGLIEFLNGFEQNLNDRYSILYSNSKPYLTHVKKVLTISNSATLQNFFRNWKNDNKTLKAFICESRPKLEGRYLAKSLLKNNIETEIITDAMAGLYIPKTDAVIIGADAVLSNGDVVNKIGSKTLAILSNYYKKPFYVVALNDKFTVKKTFISNIENPDEIWNFRHKNMRTTNIYFEIINKELITGIFSDNNI